MLHGSLNTSHLVLAFWLVKYYYCIIIMHNNQKYLLHKNYLTVTSLVGQCKSSSRSILTLIDHWSVKWYCTDHWILLFNITLWLLQLILNDWLSEIRLCWLNSCIDFFNSNIYEIEYWTVYSLKTVLFAIYILSILLWISKIIPLIIRLKSLKRKIKIGRHTWLHWCHNAMIMSFWGIKGRHCSRARVYKNWK